MAEYKDQVVITDLVLPEGGGSYVLPLATTTSLGGVHQAVGQNDSVATDIAGLLADFNSLLGKLRTAGILQVLN